MSTRAQIGYMSDDGKVRAIYNHADGYVMGLGRMLVENYNSHILANALIDMGNVLGVEKLLNPPSNRAHGYEPARWHKDTCVFFHRDRRDAWDDNKPERYKTIEAWEAYASEAWEDYMYCWMFGAWYVSEPCDASGVWVRVIDHPDFKVRV